MNKNKLIFAIIIAALLIGIIFIFLSINGSNEPKNTQLKKGAFQIWILGDSEVSFTQLVENFKLKNPDFSKQDIKVTAFSAYDEYEAALTTSIINNTSPDIFVLQNNQKNSIFENQTTVLDPSIFSPNDFRAKYRWVFSNDLIIQWPEDENKKITEYIKGLPVWYEALGIFLNRTKGIKVADLDSITSMNNSIRILGDAGKNIIPFGLGNGSTVYNVADIMTQFLLNSSNNNTLSSLDATQIKDAFNSYLFYGDNTGNNRYDSRYVEMKNFEKNNIDLFATSDIAMIAWYPRMIEEIDARWFRSFLLLAAPFPKDTSTTDGKTLIRYNYFVVNKDSLKPAFATVFLSYLASDNGATAYLDNFPYYLPALLSLEADRSEEKIHPDYNIVIKNFYSDTKELSSFDKGIASQYDKNIEYILDNPTNYADKIWSLIWLLSCKSKKIISQENLGKSCN